MDMQRFVAVQATKKEFYVLKHEPTGTPLDEHGRGLWPRDGFTFRLQGEGSVKEIDPDHLRPAPAKTKD